MKLPTTRLVLVAFCILACLLQSSKASLSSSQFVTRNGSKLMLQGSELRFGGANAYWLGLDQNEPPGVVAYPTHFRVDDALQTAKLMGNVVIRSHTLGISTGNPLSFEPELGVWNHEALDHIDYAVYRADQLGLKLIVPFTDNYHYYHGGKHDFTDWLGLPEHDFYNDTRAVDAFKDYIAHLLNHTNKYTGRRYLEEPAVMAWETGNELKPPANWTRAIAKFVKSLDSNHLVLSGHYGISVEELAIEEVDMVSDHFYPPNAARLAKGAGLAADYKKVYIAGEYGWSYNGTVTAFLNTSLNSPGAAGDLYWSLFPHADSFGFVQHNDGFSMHYPGDWEFMRTRNAEIRRHADLMRESVPGGGEPVSNASVVVDAPLLHPMFSANNSITWRGAAGACSYSLYRAGSGATSSSSTPTAAHHPVRQRFKVIAKGLTDNSLPFVDESAPPAAQLAVYIVIPYDCAGTAGPKSKVVRRQ